MFGINRLWLDWLESSAVIWTVQLPQVVTICLLIGCNSTTGALPSHCPYLSPAPAVKPHYRLLPVNTRYQELIRQESERQDRFYAQKRGLLSSLALTYKQRMLAAPDNLAWPYLYGRLLGLLGQPEEGFLIFRKISQQEPNFLWSWYGQGIYYLRKKLLTQAHDCLQHVLALDPHFVPGLLAAAKLAFLRSQGTQCLQLLEQARNQRPHDASIYHHLAVVSAALGHIQKACDYLRQALHYDPHNQAAWQDLRRLQVYCQLQNGCPTVNLDNVSREYHGLQAADARVRIAALRRLSRRHCYEALPLVLPLLADPDPWVRAMAADTLACWKPKQALGPLIQALTEPNHYVRSEIIRALQTITGQSWTSVQAWRRWWQAGQCHAKTNYASFDYDHQLESQSAASVSDVQGAGTCSDTGP